MRICHGEWKTQFIHHEMLRKYYISLLLVLLRNRMMLGDVRVQDSVLGASSAHAVAFRHSAKKSKIMH